MNQLDYESLFEEDQPVIPDRIKTFSHGNHQRSLVGDQWYYYGESGDEYALYKDIIVHEGDTFVLIDMYEDDTRLNRHPIAINKDRLAYLYPVQELFSEPMNESDAKAILRYHFIKQERSTTKEIPHF